MPRLGFGPRRIYLLGGSEGGQVVSTVWAYDPALDSWCEVASMATKRYGHSAATLGSKLYAMGGLDAGKATSLAQADVYDPRVDGWQPLPSMRTARNALAAVAVAGKVYAIGGENGGDFCDAVEAYDPLSGSWSRAASLPVARYGHTAAVVDGKIYVVGGTINNDAGQMTYTDRVDMYDPAVDSWQQRAAMPTVRSWHAAAVVDGKIYATGGCTISGSKSLTSDALEAYDPVADTWTTLASLSEARADHASVAFNGKLYVFGGFSSAAAAAARGMDLDLVEVYSPASNSWASAADMPLPIDEIVAVAL